MMLVRELWREAARFPLAMSGCITLLVLVSAGYVGQAVAIAGSMSAVLSGRASDVLVALAVIVVIALARAGLSLAQTAVSARLGGNVRRSVRQRAMHAALVAERLHDTNVQDGSMRASLGDGVDGTDAYVSKYVPAVAQLFIVCPVLIAGLWTLSPLAGVCVAAGVVLAVAGPAAWKRMMTRRGLDHWDSYEVLSADLLESLRGMSTLRVLGDVPSTRQRLHARSEELRRATERAMRASLGTTGVTDFAIQAGIAAAAMAAIVHAVTRTGPAMEVYLILLLASETFRPVRDLARHWHAGFLGLTAVPALAQIGAFTDPRTTPTPDKPAPEANSCLRAGELRVTGLWFSYPEATTPVLQGIDLTARRGSLTAVVGPSGAGKSTLFDLLLGFLTPEAGRIELDGRPLEARDIAVVSQKPVLFAGTIRDNLEAGGARSDEELRAACRAAEILEEIEAFPRSFDTELAETGSNVSGGQRQRLAMARALLAHRPVLLVDEPTSALDTGTAQAIIDTLHRVATERIVIMISHRAETLSGVSNTWKLSASRLDGSVR